MAELIVAQGATTTVFPQDTLFTLKEIYSLLNCNLVQIISQWQEWLWETMLHPEKLYSFGGEDFQEAYLVTIPDDETLESQVLEAVRNGQIQ
jgi:hypothetical protein